MSGTFHHHNDSLFKGAHWQLMHIHNQTKGATDLPLLPAVIIAAYDATAQQKIRPIGPLVLKDHDPGPQSHR